MARPASTPKTGTIRIMRLHYDIASQNLMLRVMQALAGDALAKALEQHLVFDEFARDRQAEERRSPRRSPSRRAAVSQITGHIASFGDPTLSWNKDGFVALLTAKGTVSANLNLKAPS